MWEIDNEKIQVVIDRLWKKKKDKQFSFGNFFCKRQFTRYITVSPDAPTIHYRSTEAEVIASSFVENENCPVPVD